MDSKYNFNVRITGILIEEDKILLVNQMVSEQRSWSLPGGRLEQGETLEQGLKREMKEETGLDVEVDHLLYICDTVQTDHKMLHITFLVKKINGQIELPTNEFDENPIHDVRFVAIDKLEEYGFTDKFVKLLKQGLPNAGNYMGEKSNIGLER